MLYGSSMVGHIGFTRVIWFTGLMNSDDNSVFRDWRKIIDARS